MKNNCATALLKVLFDSGVTVPRFPADIPTALPFILRNFLLAPYPTIVIPSAGTILESVVDAAKPRCGVRIKDQSFVAKTTCFWAELKKLSAADITLLFYTWPIDLMSFKAKFASQYLDVIKKGGDLTTVLDLSPLPTTVYLVCKADDKECRTSRRAGILKR